MNWETGDAVDIVSACCTTYSEAKEMLHEDFDYLSDDDKHMAIKTLLKKYGSYPASPSSAMKSASPAKKDPPKVSVRCDRELSEEDWAMVRSSDPALAMQMLRLRFKWSNMSAPTTWLRENCSGFFHLAGGNRVLFELDEDAVLFKVAFEGKA